MGLGNAAERLKSVEQKTFQVLLNNEAVRKQILAIENSSITVEQKRLLQSELFTKSLLGQRTLLQELQQISARVAPGIIAGVGAGKSRVGRSAGGFLPVGAEKSDISRGVGGAPSSAKPVVIPNFAFGGGQKGTMVANSSEYIVPNYSDAKARFVAKVDLPTPPFALEIAMVNFVPRIGFLVNFLGSSFFFIASLSSGFLSVIFLSLLVFYNKDTIYFVICQTILKVEVEVHGDHLQVEVEMVQVEDLHRQTLMQL